MRPSGARGPTVQLPFLLFLLRFQLFGLPIEFPAREIGTKHR